MNEADPVALAAEPGTLGALMRRVVGAEVPTRFYALLQVSLPLAWQCWTWGWRRSAGWLLVASAFGIWALAQQRIDGYVDDGLVVPIRKGWSSAWRTLRVVAAAIGCLTTLALVLEGFAQLMAGVFKCPGCSG